MRLPWSFGMISTRPFVNTPTQEYVVPKSMPMTVPSGGGFSSTPAAITMMAAAAMSVRRSERLPIAADNRSSSTIDTPDIQLLVLQKMLLKIRRSLLRVERYKQKPWSTAGSKNNSQILLLGPTRSWPTRTSAGLARWVDEFGPVLNFEEERGRVRLISGGGLRGLCILQSRLPPLGMSTPLGASRFVNAKALGLVLEDFSLG